MQHRILWAAIGAVLIALPCLSTAQSAMPAATAAAPEPLVDEVVVVATRSPTPLVKVGNSVTVIDEAAIRESQATAVADLLAQSPGVNFVRNGGVGQLTSVFIRGAGSDETVVLIDGVQLTDPSSTAGGFFFDSLLTADIGRIEILRGAQSTLYGSQAMGGVISVISAEPTAPFGGGFSTEAGSHDTGYATGSIGGKSEDLLWKLSGNWYGTSGFQSFDPAFGGARADASQVGGGSARVRYDLTPLAQLDARVYYTQNRVDTDGFDTRTGAFGDDNEYAKNRQFVEYTGLTIASPDHTFTNRLAYDYTDSERQEFDPGPRYPAAFYANGDLETFYGIGRNIREEYQGTWDIDERLRAVFGLQHEKSTISTDTPAFDYSPAALESSATINSGYAQLRSDVAPGLTLTAGERYDRHSEFGAHSTGQLAAAWALPGSQTILRASFGQGFKAPSLYQLFGANGVGNPALRPETATSWDAGVEQHALDGRLGLAATYFHRDSHDLIDFFFCAGITSPQCSNAIFGGYYANIDQASAHGVELQAKYRPTTALTIAGNYTLTDTENQSPGASGNELPRRPRDAANASVNYCWPSQWSATIAARYAGHSFDDTANKLGLGGYVLVDLRLGYQFSERLEAYARIENAMAKRYETVYEYGTAGRVGFIGMRAGF
ncbi:MAG: TonB-dependent receptor plug domain-containing protein [Steroidobacterales bacterium]